MENNKIVIYPNLKSITSILSILLGLMFLWCFIYLFHKACVILIKIEYFPDFPYIIMGFLFLITTLFCGTTFFFGPLSKKITINGNTVTYQNWFFMHYTIDISPETRIKMGKSYPAIGGHPIGIWKISNHRGKEKIKIHSDYFDYKKVNKEFEKLTKYKIESSNQLIKF